MDASMAGREFVLTRNTQAAPEAQPALRVGLTLPAVQLHGGDLV